LGCAPWIVSAVGNDELGRELVRCVTAWGLETGGIAHDTAWPTGTVRARLAPIGEATYLITRDVAWDQLRADAETRRKARTARGIVFGSLAQRSVSNRETFDQLLHALPPGAERIFDVNLRSPHDDLALVRHLAAKASLPKLNAHEATRLADTGADAEPEHCARTLATTTGCGRICITAGERGAGFLTDGAWYFEPGRAVAVRDTIGAGDAFLAGFLAEYLRTRDSRSALRSGCRLGEWVATQPGATPPHPNQPL
jgi:fructokinase